VGHVLLLSGALSGLTLTHTAFGQAPAASPPASAAAPASVPPPASQASSRAEEAERLFERGVQRMDASDFEAACPLLAQSQALDPSSGTLLNLGDCYEHLGRSASADSAFAQALELARATGRQDRSQVASLRRSRLAPQLRRLRVIVSATAAQSMVVSLDDKPIPSKGDPVAVDPGTHRVRASAPGFEDFVGQVTAPAPGATLDVSIPELVHAENAPAPPAADSAQTQKKPLDGRQIAALTCGAVGVIGIVSGSVFGLRSISKHNESDQYCDGNLCRDQRGVDAMDSARSAGNISTASFIIGGAALGAAAALWFIRPATSERGLSARVTFGPGAVDVRGTF
jgi:hypothetical protein